MHSPDSAPTLCTKWRKSGQNPGEYPQPFEGPSGHPQGGGSSGPRGLDSLLFDSPPSPDLTRTARDLTCATFP
jgi:hypothetical protein